MNDPAFDKSASLPAAYRAGRACDLGRITDRIEKQVILGLVGTVRAKRVLDLGGGDGVLPVLLTRAGAEVTGLCPNPRMVAAARDRASRADPAVAIIEGDVRQLPFADDTFDVVVAITVLCFVDDAKQAVNEMARVLQPGGRQVMDELGRHSLWAAKRRLSRWLGSETLHASLFRSARELKALARVACFDVAHVRGTIYYPPCNRCPRWLAPFDAGRAAKTNSGRLSSCLSRESHAISHEDRNDEASSHPR